MAYGSGSNFDGAFILFLVLILLVFGTMPYFGGYSTAES